MKNNQSIWIIYLIFSVLIHNGCQGKIDTNEKQIITRDQILSNQNLYEEHIVEIHRIGIESVIENNIDDYNKVIRHYGLSRYTNRGISIALLMASRNNYGKAYYDCFDFTRRFSKEEGDIDTYLYFLKKAKKNGYKFKDIRIDKFEIKYNEL